MSAAPCPSCGAVSPGDPLRCARCGATLRRAPNVDGPTAPGQPLIRGEPRRRISSYDYVPLALQEELSRKREALAGRHGKLSAAQTTKVRASMAVGAALTTLPFVAAGFAFLPRRADALFLVVPDLLVGALAGSLVARLGGGAFRGVFWFLPAFGAVVCLEVYLGYPIVQNPASGAVLGVATLASLLVAAFLGAAVDEHEG